MERRIEYFIKSSYGNSHFYVKDAKQAESIRLLTGAKTMTVQHRTALERLGFELVEVLERA